MALPGLRAGAGRDYLLGLANETGGLRVRSNDMRAVLQRANEDASQYCLVGYAAPTSGSKKGLREISLSVKRRGIQVRYRTGYLEPRGQPIPGKDVVLALAPDEHARMTAAANLRVVLGTPTPRRGRYTLTVVARDSSGWIAARVLPCCG